MVRLALEPARSAAAAGVQGLEDRVLVGVDLGRRSGDEEEAGLAAGCQNQAAWVVFAQRR